MLAPPVKYKYCRCCFDKYCVYRDWVVNIYKPLSTLIIRIVKEKIPKEVSKLAARYGIHPRLFIQYLKKTAYYMLYAESEGKRKAKLKSLLLAFKGIEDTELYRAISEEVSRALENPYSYLACDRKLRKYVTVCGWQYIEESPRTKLFFPRESAGLFVSFLPLGKYRGNTVFCSENECYPLPSIRPAYIDITGAERDDLKLYFINRYGGVSLSDYIVRKVRPEKVALLVSVSRGANGKEIPYVDLFVKTEKPLEYAVMLKQMREDLGIVIREYEVETLLNKLVLGEE